MEPSEQNDEKSEQPQVINLSQTRTDMVEAEFVRASQSGIGHIDGQEVELQQSAAGEIHAGSMMAHDSAVGFISGANVTVEDSIVGGIRANELRLNSGISAVSVSTSSLSHETKAIITIGQHIKANTIHTGILIGRDIQGNVTTSVDTRTAILSALAGGAITGLILLTGRLLFGPKNKSK